MASQEFEEYDIEVPYKNSFIKIDIYFTAYANVTHYCSAYTNCAADYASDSEFEYEAEVENVEWHCCNENGEEIALTDEQKEVCDKYANSYAEDYVRDYDDWNF